MATMAEQAIAGLRVSKDGNVVMVNDGADRWLCRREEWDAALSLLGEIDAIEKRDADEQHEADAEAYSQLCRAVRAPVASSLGSNRGDVVSLVREAVSLGMIEPDTARRLYGVQVSTGSTVSSGGAQ